MKWFFLLTIIIPTMNSYSQQLKRADTIELNGLQTYYEVYGKGNPLFLLHGFTQSSISWSQFIPEYSNDYEIYLVDLMGHGKSSAFVEDVSVKSAARNLLDLIGYLGLDSINAIGYSYGGEILFQLALINPDLIKSMIIIGSCGTWHAKDFPEFVEYLSYKNVDNLPWMREQQISDERIKNILNQFPNYAVQLSEAELKSIKTRTLLVAGDHDYATPLECVIKAKTNMPNAFLWIVPNTEHRVHLDKNKDLFLKISKDFLNNNHW
ncbi:alpha/beta fold hydrolase [Catalinimonas niigatensis]|uniref:alpha/beta fold hydrolase n=1 Tax=Catalinimonas niigatensis TaxID=1397264 RepID=UPI002666420E|nr:alpha/beta hydrolase [Catalinimonas niigatensis]WPP49955.1 alpha/beta hydrolase [Catalinimonas niigatensis]